MGYRLQANVKTRELLSEYLRRLDSGVDSRVYPEYVRNTPISGALQIGALSKESGFSVDAIRFYERQRLIRSPRRSDGNFRLFGKEDLAALHFIKSAQELGFSLEEIRELLALRSDQGKACPKMQGLLQAKVLSVERKIKSLTKLREELKAALRKCERALTTVQSDPHRGCPVLNEISGNREKR